jgi:PilZ domain-containing protein
MGNERRRAARAKVNLPARWEGVLTQQDATVTSLSKNGCFLLTGGVVEPKELIRLEIELPEGEPIYFWAEVVEAADEIGFAARFTSMTDDDEARLNSLLIKFTENS